MNYYGIPTKGFTSTGYHTNVIIYPNNDSYSSTKYIRTVSQSTDAITFFSGWYHMKVEYLFTGTITTNQLIDNTDEMNLELQEQNDFLQNSNVVDDNTITGYTNEIDNSVSSIKDDFDNSNEKKFLTNFFEYLTVDNSEEYNSFNTLDLSFTAFGRNYDIQIPSSLTKDFILNGICHGNVSQRNNIVTTIQSVYALVFGVFFVKKFYEIFKHIITLNFDGFDAGADIINML